MAEFTECPTCGPRDDPNCFIECVCECHDRVDSVIMRGGVRVTLKANAEEGWPEQRGIVEGVDHLAWGICVTVRLDVEDREDARDDGIRECTIDQIKEVG